VQVPTEGPPELIFTTRKNRGGGDQKKGGIANIPNGGENTVRKRFCFENVTQEWLRRTRR